MNIGYKLNPETLEYEKVEKSSGFGVKNIFWILISAIGFGFIFIVFIAYIYPSPYERQLKTDLSILESNYGNILKKIEYSYLLYGQLLAKDKEIHKLTFDVEMEKIQSLNMEMSFLSSDINFSSLLKNIEEKLNYTSKKLNNLLSKTKLTFDYAYNRQAFLQSVPSILPIAINDFVLVSGFGLRVHPIFKTLRQHNGIDFASRQGNPVMATGNGVVVRPPNTLEGLGNIVAIDHGFGYVSIYACLLKSEVKTGQKINRGEIIGYIGRSGIATGPHLHYEIHKNNKAVNPINYFFMSITPEELLDFIEKSSIQNQNMS